MADVSFHIVLADAAFLGDTIRCFPPEFLTIWPPRFCALLQRGTNEHSLKRD